MKFAVQHNPRFPQRFLIATLILMMGYSAVAQAEDTMPLIEEGEPTRFLIAGDGVTVEEAQRYSQQYGAVMRAVPSRIVSSQTSGEISSAHLNQLVTDLRFINASRKSWEIIVLMQGRPALLSALQQLGDGGLSQASGRIQFVDIPEVAGDPEIEQAVAKASGGRFHVTRITGHGPVQAEWGTPDPAVVAAQDARDATFAAARSRILPQLAPKAMFEENQLRDIVHADFLNGLILYYVVEHPEARIPEGVFGAGRSLSKFISQKELIQWRITERELFQSAIANISTPERNQTYREVTSAPGKMFVVATDDGFAAARLLSIGLMGMWAKEVQDDLVIAIPTKDVLYATPRSNEAGIEYLKKLATEQFHKQERNLTDKLLVFHVTDGTISEFPEGTPRHSSDKRYIFLPNGLIHGGPVKGLPRDRVNMKATTSSEEWPDEITLQSNGED